MPIFGLEFESESSRKMVKPERCDWGYFGPTTKAELGLDTVCVPYMGGRYIKSDRSLSDNCDPRSDLRCCDAE